MTAKASVNIWYSLHRLRGHIRKFNTLQASITSYDHSNSTPAQLIKNLNVKHNNNKTFKQQTIKNAEQVYQNISNPTKDYDMINSFLRLCFDYSYPHKILNIWNDIELFHQQNPYKKYKGKTDQKFLEYSLLIKCLLKTDKKELNCIDKYIQLLTWIKERNYRLTIHDFFVHKLISLCANKYKSVNTNTNKHNHGEICMDEKKENIINEICINENIEEKCIINNQENNNKNGLSLSMPFCSKTV
eukprot:173027_1